MGKKIELKDIMGSVINIGDRVALITVGKRNMKPKHVLQAVRVTGYTNSGTGITYDDPRGFSSYRTSPDKTCLIIKGETAFYKKK